jgi:hypothetical protein
MSYTGHEEEAGLSYAPAAQPYGSTVPQASSLEMNRSAWKAEVQYPCTPGF